jgi:carboxymethylenebutenolidase
MPFCNGRVAIMGGCSGGRQSYLGAVKLDVDAAIDCWGGSVVVPPEQLNPAHPVAPIDYTAEISCPLLGIFGADDYNPTLRQVEITEEALKANDKDYEFHVFEDAGHSFMTTDELNFRVNQTVRAWGTNLRVPRADDRLDPANPTKLQTQIDESVSRGGDLDQRME